jgi:hypothetical protein
MSAATNDRLSIEGLSHTFLDALGGAVSWHSAAERKPLEIDCKSPLPPKLRVYIYNATYPPGGGRWVNIRFSSLFLGRNVVKEEILTLPEVEFRS